jgi:hypothetical protein
MIVGAGRGDTSPAQYDDYVSPTDLGNAMGDDDRGPSPGSVEDGPLDLIFCGAVDRAS